VVTAGSWAVGSECSVRSLTTRAQASKLQSSLTSCGLDDLIGILVEGLRVRNAGDPVLSCVLTADDGGMLAVIEVPA
jgi:hypothetical protein